MIKVTLVSILSVIVMFLGVQHITVQTAYAVEGGTDCGGRTLLGIPAWDKYLVHEEYNGRCSAVVNGFESAMPIGLAILEAMIRLGGLVAVVMIIVGSFRFITSQGNPENAAAARKTIINSLIGLVIVIIATTTVSFIGNRLASTGGESGYLETVRTVS